MISIYPEVMKAAGKADIDLLLEKLAFYYRPGTPNMEPKEKAGLAIEELIAAVGLQPIFVQGSKGSAFVMEDDLRSIKAFVTVGSQAQLRDSVILAMGLGYFLFSGNRLIAGGSKKSIGHPIHPEHINQANFLKFDRDSVKKELKKLNLDEKVAFFSLAVHFFNFSNAESFLKLHKNTGINDQVVKWWFAGEKQADNFVQAEAKLNTSREALSKQGELVRKTSHLKGMDRVRALAKLLDSQT